MSGNKRQRELARAKYERQQERRAQSASSRKQRQRITAIAVVAVLVLGALVWVVVSRTSSTPEPLASATPPVQESFPTPTAPVTSAAAPTEPAPSELPASDPAAAEPAILDCTAPGTPRADDVSFPSAPPADGQAGRTLTFDTNCGPIVIELDPNAPATVASEVFLAQEGFYDNTTCHRLTTAGIFVLQCGDPRGDGTGGPGYSVPDENLPATEGVNYPAGTVAMANAGPGTAGSQFFIVYDDTTLPPAYTVWGTVTEGLDLVKEIASVGVADGSGDGAPRQPVFIESATVGS